MFKITVVLSALAVYCIQIASAVGGFGYPGAVGLYSGGFGGPKFGGEGLEGGGKFGPGFGGAGYGIEGPKIGYGLQGPKIGGIGYGGLEGPKIGGIGYGGLEGPKLGGAGGFGYGPAKFTPVQGFEAGGAKFGGAGYGGPVALPVPKYGGYGVAGGLGGGYGGGIGQEKVALSYAGPLVHEKISVGGYGGEGLGFGGVKYGGLGGAGAGVGLGGPKLGLGYGGAVGGLGPVGHVGYGGGEILSKGEFSEGKKGINDAQFHAASGKKGEEFEEGQKGFKLGKAAEKNVKGDSGFYSGEEAGKKLAEDEKAYHGSKHYAQEGKNGAEKKVKQGHKKGHVIKGFKSSHHKDESGKTEEFYDEEHDEGEHASADGHSGSFGEGSAASFKGAHEDSDFKANQGGQKGGYEKEHLIDGNNGGGSQFSSKKFGGEDSNFGYKKGADEESVLGHKDSTKYFKHLPFHHGGF